MQITELDIISKFDNLKLKAREYRPENYQKVVLIVHGMCEHQLRYSDFATYLAKHGFLVYTYDHRGHGGSIGEGGTLGYFAKKQGAQALITDLDTVVDFIKDNNKELEIYLFAHSMGSIIARCFLQTGSQKVAKVILSGAPNYQGLAPFGLFLANVVSLFEGEKKRSKFLTKLSLGNFNKAVANPTSPNDWISYNQSNIDKYNNDPLCGFTFTNNGYKALFKLLIRMHKVNAYLDVKETLPICFMAGADDPCTGGTKGLINSEKTLKTAGFKNILKEEFAGMRHEILNEIDRKNIFEEVLEFYG